MKDKFKFLFSESYFKKIRSKAFVITNILLFLGIIILMNLPHIISFFGGDFEKTSYIYLEVASDDNHLIYDLIDEKVNEIAKFTKQNIEVTNEVKEKEELDFSIKIELADEKFKVSNTYYTGNQVKQQLVKQGLNEAYNEYIKITNPEVFSTFDKLNKALEIKDINQVEDSFDDFGYILSMVISLIIFFAVLFAMQFIGGEIIEEKSSKMIETVLSNVTPFTHLSSKVLAVLCFLVTQLVLTIIYIFVAAMISQRLIPMEGIEANVNIDLGPILDILPRVILSVTPFIIVGYILFSLLVAMFSSMATSIQDYNQFITPVMLMLLASFYLSMFSSLFEGATFIKILGFIPFLSPILAPTLYNNGGFNLLELLISFSIIVVLIIAIFKYVMQVYRLSLLDYSEEGLIKKLKSVRQKIKNDKKEKTALR